jgi:hypothetical protein
VTAGGAKMGKSLGNALLGRRAAEDGAAVGVALLPRRRPLPLDGRVPA